MVIIDLVQRKQFQTCQENNHLLLAFVIVERELKNYQIVLIGDAFGF